MVTGEGPEPADAQAAGTHAADAQAADTQRSAARRVDMRRVFTAVAFCASALFVGGAVIDVIRASRYRHFYLTADVSCVLLLVAAGVYLQWGPRLVVRRRWAIAGRVAQGYAVLLALSQTFVWIHVSIRGTIWWGVLMAIPVLLMSALTIAGVHDAFARAARSAAPPAQDAGNAQAQDVQALDAKAQDGRRHDPGEAAKPGP